MNKYLVHIFLIYLISTLNACESDLLIEGKLKSVENNSSYSVQCVEYQSDISKDTVAIQFTKNEEQNTISNDKINFQNVNGKEHACFLANAKPTNFSFTKDQSIIDIDEEILVQKENTPVEEAPPEPETIVVEKIVTITPDPIVETIIETLPEETESTCLADGYFWYDDACHELSQSDMDKVACELAGMYWHGSFCNGLTLSQQTIAECEDAGNFWYLEACQNVKTDITNVQMALKIDDEWYVQDSTPGIMINNLEAGEFVNIYSGDNCQTLLSKQEVTSSTQTFHINLSETDVYQFTINISNANNDFGPCSSKVIDYYYESKNPFVNIFSHIEGNTFIGLRANGEITAWGSSSYGANFNLLKKINRKDVINVYPYDYGFVIMHEDRSITMLASETSTPGLQKEVDELNPQNVQIVVPNRGAMAALSSTGNVYAWGNDIYGGKQSDVDALGLTNVSKLYNNSYSFAAIQNGEIFAWGDPNYGGDQAEVNTLNITNAVSIVSTSTAYAALKSDGTIAVWGDDSKGGDQTDVNALSISNASKLYANSYAFAVLKADGTVSAWGNSSYGGNQTEVNALGIANAIKIFGRNTAFAALLSNGTVKVWGGNAGDQTEVDALALTGVVDIVHTKASAAALKADGTVAVWGTDSWGGDQTEVDAINLNNVSKIVASDSAFAVLLTNGTIKVWGNGSEANQEFVETLNITNAVEIYATKDSFSALLADGRVRKWGQFGVSTPAPNHSNFNKIYGHPNGYAFTSILNDGSVQVWGNYSYGGNQAEVDALGTLNVSEIFYNSQSFALLKPDLSIAVFGDPNISGGDQTEVDALGITNPTDIVVGSNAFAALKNDGTVAAWGYDPYGGDQTEVDALNLTNIVNLQSLHRGFLAEDNIGDLYVWGGGTYGTQAAWDALNIPNIADIAFANSYATTVLDNAGQIYQFGDPCCGGEVLSNADLGINSVVKLVNTDRAFAVLSDTNQIKVWGYWIDGGDQTYVDTLDLGPIIDLQGTSGTFYAFDSNGDFHHFGLGANTIYVGNIKEMTCSMDRCIILRNDGTVFDPDYMHIVKDLNKIAKLYPIPGGFAALHEDGSVSTWGDSNTDISMVKGSLQGFVVDIFSTGSSTAAMRSDGSVVLWGSYSHINPGFN